MVEEPEGLITDPSKFKHQSVEEIKEGGARAREREAELVRREQEIKDRQESYSRAIQERRLSEDDEYREFQNSERWCNTRLEIGTQITQPDFWLKASPEERRIYEYRAELARSVYIKRSAGFTLEGQHKNPELAGFSKTETAALYRVPGVKEALEAYIEYIDNWDDERYRLPREVVLEDDGQKDYSILEIQDRDEAERIRNQITQEVLPVFTESLKERGGIIREDLQKEANRKARDAEQIAFNLLYVGNVFESLDAKFMEITDKNDPDYGKTVRKRKLELGLMASELVNPPIKFIMNPMDTLVVRSARGTERLKMVGTFGEWAQKQMEEALINAGIVEDGKPDYKEITRIEVVPTGSDEAKDKWWTAERYEFKIKEKDEETGEVKETGEKEKGVRLYVPDCYPVKLMESFWEETKMTPRPEQYSPKRKNRQSVLQFLRDKKEIPWENPETAGMWTDYMGSIRAVDSIWQYYKGENKIAFKQFGAFTVWRDGLAKPLANFRWNKDEIKKRWLLYASWGVKRDTRLPEITMTDYQKDVIKYSLGEKNLNYLPEDKIYFEWDKISWRGKLF